MTSTVAPVGFAAKYTLNLFFFLRISYNHETLQGSIPQSKWQLPWCLESTSDKQLFICVKKFSIKSLGQVRRLSPKICQSQILNLNSLKHYQIWISILVWNHLRDTLRESRVFCVNIKFIVTSQPKYRYMIMTVHNIWKVSVNSEKLIDWFEKFEKW